MQVTSMDHRIVSTLRVMVVLFLMCLVAAAPSIAGAAALPVDSYLEVEGGSIIGGAHAVGGSWAIARNNGGLSVGATNAHALRGPVVVNGVEYSGASTQALILNDDAHGDYITFTATANHPIISFGGFINIGVNKNYALNDVFYIDNTSGYPWIVSPQIIADNTCSTCVQIESAVGNSTVHGSSKKPVTPGKTYWFSSKVDATAGKVYLSLFDPDNDYAEVYNQSIASDNWSSSSKLVLRMGRQDAHTGNSTQGTKSYLDNIIIDWTNHAYPLIPGAGTITPPPPAPVKPAPPTNLQVQ